MDHHDDDFFSGSVATGWELMRLERVCGSVVPVKTTADAKNADSKELWKSVGKAKAEGG